MGKKEMKRVILNMTRQSTGFFFFFSLKYSGFTILCKFQVYSKEIQWFQIIFRYRLLQDIESLALYSESLLFTYFMYSSTQLSSVTK